MATPKVLGSASRQRSSLVVYSAILMIRTPRRGEWPKSEVLMTVVLLAGLSERTGFICRIKQMPFSSGENIFETNSPRKCSLLADLYRLAKLQHVGDIRVVWIWCWNVWSCRESIHCLVGRIHWSKSLLGVCYGMNWLKCLTFIIYVAISKDC